MPGPLAGFYRINGEPIPVKEAHKACQSKYKCKGAGCVVHTGKTARRRMRKARRR
jgi:hypothetical protein